MCLCVVWCGWRPQNESMSCHFWALASARSNPAHLSPPPSLSPLPPSSPHSLLPSLHLHSPAVLYDNPQLACTYLAAFQVTRDQQYASEWGGTCTAHALLLHLGA